MFENFWDSEVPRIGEDGAQGWASWVAENDAGTVPDLQPSIPLPQDTPSDPYQVWAQQEKNLDDKIQRPLRLRTATYHLDDPYRIVILSDFSSLLTPLVTPTARRNVLFVCLHFFGLHTPGSTPPPDDTWADDRWMKREGALFPEVLKSAAPLVIDGGALVGHERTLRASWGPVKEWGWGAGRIIGAESDRMVGGRTWEAEDVSGVDVDFLR